MNVSVFFALDIRQPKLISSTRHSIEYVVCLAALHFPRLSHKQHYFRGGGGGGNLLNTKCVFWFPLQICLKRFSFWENSAIYCHKRTYLSTERNRISFKILFELKFSPQIFRKIPKCKISRKSVEMFRTDRRERGSWFHSVTILFTKEYLPMSIPCCMWPAPRCKIFPRYLMNGTVFGWGGSHWTQNVFWIPLQLVSKISHFKRKWER